MFMMIRFLSSLLLSCPEMIIECQVGVRQSVDGRECCRKYFDSTPHLTLHGTCFGTKTGVIPVGEGITVTSRHETLDLDLDMVTSDMAANIGLAVAVVDSNVSPAAALLSQAGLVSPDKSVVIAVTPTTVDNTDLSTSLIGLRTCVEPGDEVGRHLNLNQNQFGYSHQNCIMSKTELGRISPLL